MEHTNRRLLRSMCSQLMPFTTDTVLCLAAALKLQGYTSAKNYINAAVIQAERLGAVLSDELRRCIKDSKRSAMRGVGPGKHCERLVFELLPSLDGGRMALNVGGPMNPRSTCNLGSWFHMREIEFSGAEHRSMTFNPVIRTVSLCLPASKCDPLALGETVTHGCCCSVAGPWIPLCPYHLCVDHFRWLLASRPDWFDGVSEPLPGFPLFPSRSGKSCTKDCVMCTIRVAAEMLGMPLCDSAGRWLHSGHALRVTGLKV